MDDGEKDEKAERIEILERALIRDYGATFEEHDESYFAKLDTKPGPTPQGRPGVSRG